ncbi:MAG: hypothetical protein QM780_09495 [Hyphomicrobium sp.]|uniref:hypothetical protein n=1 Tax=Hyphomicrobium sp. TaxID=82 RepID=UPI0039E6007C
MTRDVKGTLQFGAGTTTAVIALIAGSYLTMSGTTARTEPNDHTTEIAKTDGWAATTLAEPATDPQSLVKTETIVSKQYLGANVDSADDQDASPKEKKKTDKKAASTKGAFRPDPKYSKKYDADGQADIYGGKYAVEPPRPLLELGREQYTSGPYDESSTILGKLNPLLPGLSVYGDWRTAVAYNSNNGKDIAQIATRLNLDVDFKITGTERIHAFFTPIQDGAANFSRFEFGGGDGDQRFHDEFDLNPQTLFFEGDVGSIYSGLSGQYSKFDLPFTVGLFPLFLQNGIWANDAILGGAVTLPAQNSPALGLSNYDITFFTAFDNVDNASLVGANGKVDNHDANLYGVTTFVDAFGGYIEAGYGFLQGVGNREDVQQHFLTAAYSRRYANTISNSTRVFANFGEDDRGNGDGLAIISENSLISPLPSTLLPYANFFVGFGNPEPLVDGNNAGILKNVGINFETDALTGYPKLDDTGSNAVGGAIGVEYLFNLDQQLVFEVATVQPYDDNNVVGAKGPQYGFGVRYQIPLTRAWLFRADATYQIRDGEDDNFGIRTELRRKF